jgi:TPR repeat protein
MNLSFLGSTVPALLAVAALLTIAPPAAAQYEELAPHERAWFERWGVVPADRYDQDAILRKSRAQKRVREMIAAADSGDVVAWFITGLVLARRCNDGKRVSRQGCAAFEHWMDERHPRSRAARPPGWSWPVAEWMYLSGERGDYDARNYLQIGKLFELGVGGPPDYEVAHSFYARQRYNDSLPDSVRAEAALRLGAMAELGRGKPANMHDALDQYRAAVEFGNPRGAFIMATHLLQTGQTKEPRKRRTVDDYLRQAADGGIASAAFLAGYRLEKGQAKPPKGQKLVDLIFRYYRQAAMAGHVGAMTGLGYAYYKGWGTRPNARLAEEWWEKAGRAGDGDAAYRVAVLHSKRGDYPGSMPWLRRAAEAGIPRAADDYAQLRANGWEERSLKGTLLGVVSAIFDIQAQAAEQRRQEQLFEESVTRATLTALADERVAAMSASSSGGDGRKVTGGIILRDDSEFQAEQEEIRRLAEQEEAAARSRSSQVAA